MIDRDTCLLGVSYLRVSTDRQGRSGLGIEAQRASVLRYAASSDVTLIREFVEVESGKRSDRPKLYDAMASCRLHRAVLIVAKLDRLARNAHFLLGLRDAGIEFVAVDLPFANRLTIGILAMVAEEEARLISERTKAALAAAKARGTVLGCPRNLNDAGRRLGASLSLQARRMSAAQRLADLQPILQSIREGGAQTYGTVAEALNSRGIQAPRGGRWHPASVRALQKASEDMT